MVLGLRADGLERGHDLEERALKAEGGEQSAECEKSGLERYYDLEGWRKKF